MRIRGVLAALALASMGAGQRHEVGLTLGRLTGIDRDNVNFGSGIGLQANYGYRLHDARRWALFGEVHFLANPLREIASSNTSVTRDVASLYVLPGLRVKFRPAASWSPYLAAGLGYALYEQSHFRIDGEPNPAPRFTHRGAVGFGGGVDFKVWRFVGGRVEVRDFYSGNPSFNVPLSGGQHNLVAGGGIVLKFGGEER